MRTSAPFARYTPLLNAWMRIVALAGRFILSIYIAKYIGLAGVGSYGLITGLVGLAPGLLGFGLNYRLNREIVGEPHSLAIAKIRDRILITTTLSAISSAPIFIIFFYVNGEQLVWSMIFCLIFVIEVFFFDVHLSLISLQHAVFANFLLFVRSSVWVYPYIVLGLIDDEFRSIHVLMAFWLGSLSVCLILLTVFTEASLWRVAFSTKIDWAWLRTSVMTSRLIYISDIGIIGTTYLDRFVVEALLGLEATGIYVFFWSLANAVQVIVNSAIVQLVMPRLVLLLKEGSHSRWASTLRKESVKSFLSGIACSLAIFLFVELVVPLLGRKALEHNELLFSLMLFAFCLRVLADVVNCGLYSRSLDKQWAYTNIAGICMSSTGSVVGISAFGLIGISYSMILVNVVLLCLRISAIRYTRPMNVQSV